MAEADRHSLMTEYIDDNSEKDITLQSLFFKEIDETNSPALVNLILNDESILRKYRKELQEHTHIHTFDTLDHLKYDYKPWLLSFDLYGTTELWLELLDLNQMRSFSEFNRDNILVFDFDILSKLISIIDLETEKISLNEDELIKAKRESD